jgi:hypothetical protein
MFENIEIFLLFIKVAWLQNCGVFMENKLKIMQYMDETYEYRKYQIANVLYFLQLQLLQNSRDFWMWISEDWYN